MSTGTMGSTEPWPQLGIPEGPYHPSPHQHMSSLSSLSQPISNSNDSAAIIAPWLVPDIPDHTQPSPSNPVTPGRSFGFTSSFSRATGGSASSRGLLGVSGGGGHVGSLSPQASSSTVFTLARTRGTSNAPSFAWPSSTTLLANSDPRQQEFGRPRSTEGTGRDEAALGGWGTTGTAGTSSNKKSSMNIFKRIKKKASRVGLGTREGSDEGHVIPPLPTSSMIPNLGASTSTSGSSGGPFGGFSPPSPPPVNGFKKRKGFITYKHRDKDRDHHHPNAYSSYSPSRPSDEPELMLDTNLDEMEGIIDPTHVKANGPGMPQQPLFGGKLGPGGDPSFKSSTTENGSTPWDESNGQHPSSSFDTFDGAPTSPSYASTKFTDPFSTGTVIAGGSIHKTHTTTLSLDSHPPEMAERSKTILHAPTINGLSPKGSGPRPFGETVAGGVSPKAAGPGTVIGNAAGSLNKDSGNDPAWYAPESWDVDKVGPEAEYSSDEGDTDVVGNDAKSDIVGELGVGVGVGMGMGMGMGLNVIPGTRTRNTSVATSAVARRGKSDFALRKDSWPEDDPLSRRPSEATTTTMPRTPSLPYQLRVYRSDGTWNVVWCPINTTINDVQHVLRKKLLLSAHSYKLYLRERGRERVLGPQEKPIMILRRRLDQAGYDELDGLETLGGEDLGFLLRFIFRDATISGMQATGGEDNLTSFEHVDLTGRGLLTIPIALHRHAHTIVTLNLSKNPHVDLPSDFIQSCGELKELRLCQSALKKVPQSVQKIHSLHWLDISCNRIIDLDSAGLDQIPHLRDVMVQNNRLFSLPKYFAAMSSLKYLNISNNKFEQIPDVLGQMKSLVDLDVSFNLVSVFPPELGQLVNLERLVIVGNKISSFPAEVEGLVSLKELDCRRNSVTDLATVFRIPNLEVLRVENNMLQDIELVSWSSLKTLCVSGNDRLINFKVTPPPEPQPHQLFLLSTLDLSRCTLSHLDDLAISQLKSLVSLKFDHNQLRAIPESICGLSYLTHLSGSNNSLGSLPTGIGQLMSLQSLHVHNNNIKVIPAGIWLCQNLVEFNASSNLITIWEDFVPEDAPHLALNSPDRKTSSAGFSTTQGMRATPPLASSLQRLYLADNRLSDDIFDTLSFTRELKILNLSFNDIYELPPLRRQAFAQLRELYLSGNKLTSLPGEDLYRLTKLKVLFLNANKLQTLPTELRKVTALESLDVGSNQLKYNIANWQFDWNWNFNHALRYLNLSGNKRLEIKNTIPSSAESGGGRMSLQQRGPLSDFGELVHLRNLGLMDVTLSVNPSIPDENEDRRVRTSPSDINGMAYGIADTLGKVDNLSFFDKLSMFDLVVPGFRGRDNECLFGMFGRATSLQSSNKLSKYLHEHFSTAFADALENIHPERGEYVRDALRRAFLNLNKEVFDFLQPAKTHPNRKSSTLLGGTQAGGDSKSAASGLVVYIVDEKETKRMYVANVGNILAVLARKGASTIQVSTNHDPFDRSETARIRSAEGWVSPKGAVNDEVEISRSFGMFHLLPSVNARPDVAEVTLTDQDELVIIGNRGLWDYVAPQTAVDIARLSKDDPMIAAQRLRDYAMSYGADGSTMIMVISVGDLFVNRTRQPVIDPSGETDAFFEVRRPPTRRNEPVVGDRTLARLEKEVPPPTGHLALVFTDIRNSTSLWEKNPGMPAAMRLHNQLLRRQLREDGGYEVKTEGDAFIVSFPTVASALLWCFNVQIQLLQEEWPLWILDSEEGKVIHDSEGMIVARGLSVRMGIHFGAPNCEPDPITGRMDYFGTMVNRTARISASARGGQIMVSSDVIREINRLIEMEPTEKVGMSVSRDGPTEAKDLGHHERTVEAIRRLGVIVQVVGESRLKGLEVPELLSLVFPKDLSGRLEMMQNQEAEGAAASSSRVNFSLEQIRDLAMLAIRIEALASDRVLRTASAIARRDALQRKQQQDHAGDAPPPNSLDDALFMATNPDLLMPTIRENATDADLLILMDSLSVRIENALASLHLKQMGGYNVVLGALEQFARVDSRMLVQALAMFNSLME